MRKFIEARKAAKTEGGFSLIDVVVTVAIIVALSVGGFIAYTGLIASAKDAAVAGAADQVYTAIVVAENDSLPGTNAAGVIADFNASTDGKIEVATTGSGNTLKVQAWNKEDASKATFATSDHTAERGYTAPVTP